MPTETKPDAQPAIPAVVSIQIGNLQPADAQFLRNVVSLFADPQYSDHLHRLQSGQAVIQYAPAGGLALLTPK